MRIHTAILALGLLAACKPAPAPDFPGVKAPEYFPFDGQRQWLYISTDKMLPYKYVGQMRSLEPDVVDGVNTYPIDYITDCVRDDEDCTDLATVRTISWASDPIDGVFIYNWTEGAAQTYFDPPLKIADRNVKVGNTYTTETGGATWTSTIVGLEPCPVRFSNSIGNCLHFAIDDGDDIPDTGKGLVGDYWAAPGYNVVGMQAEGSDSVWELSFHDCTWPEDVDDAECDGEW